MAKFIHGNEINLELEKMIRDAEEYLILVSPYIKLHDRLKAELKSREQDYKLEIIVLFGKNEGEVDRSVKREDIEFFLRFPNIKICHEKNLHAKYYANESFSLLTSMNLHQFSQNNNIEAGIIMYPKNGLEQIANVIVSTQNIDEEANGFFNELIERSDIIYQSVPTYKKELLGLSKKFTGKEIKIDRIDEYFKKKTSYLDNNQFSQSDSTTTRFFNKPEKAKNTNSTAFCIRTGTPIPFNRHKPFCDEAFETWKQFNNPDYPEKYCHSTGKPSYGKTSMRNPVLGGLNP